MTSLMEDVINRARAPGAVDGIYRAPPPGKTGTSRDGWFAGYTSNLLCVVWMGFDDNREPGAVRQRQAPRRCGRTS